MPEEVAVTSICGASDTVAPRFRRIWGVATALAAAAALGACSTPRVAGTPSRGNEVVGGGDAPVGVTRGGSVFDLLGGGQVGNLQFGSGRGEGFVGSVNKHLWQASLETLAFMPIASTDPYTGVIATDWSTPPASPDERFKVTAFVTATALDPSSLRVAVFRETRGENGAWISAPVAPETPRQIEDSILVRARQLRLAERGAG
jgi:hypothetical protein